MGSESSILNDFIITIPKLGRALVHECGSRRAWGQGGVRGRVLLTYWLSLFLMMYKICVDVQPFPSMQWAENMLPAQLCSKLGQKLKHLEQF